MVKKKEKREVCFCSELSGHISSVTKKKIKKEYSRRTCLQQCKPLVITLINLVPFFLINEAHFYAYSFAFIFLVRARNLNLTSKLKAL